MNVSNVDKCLYRGYSAWCDKNIRTRAGLLELRCQQRSFVCCAHTSEREEVLGARLEDVIVIAVLPATC